MLGIKQEAVGLLHAQANGVVERWNCMHARHISSFMSCGPDDLDEHVTSACFCYNISLCETTGMTPFEAMFEVDAFEA